MIICESQIKMNTIPDHIWTQYFLIEDIWKLQQISKAYYTKFHPLVLKTFQVRFERLLKKNNVHTFKLSMLNGFACYTGSAVLSTIVDETWEDQDVDVFCEEACMDDYGGMATFNHKETDHPFTKELKKIFPTPEMSVSELEDYAGASLPGWTFQVTLKQEDQPKKKMMDICVKRGKHVKDCSQLVDDFDFAMCKCRYYWKEITMEDGSTIALMELHIENPQDTFRRMYEVSETLGEFLQNNAYIYDTAQVALVLLTSGIRTLKRWQRYKQRGFRYKENRKQKPKRMKIDQYIRECI